MDEKDRMGEIAIADWGSLIESIPSDMKTV